MSTETNRLADALVDSADRLNVAGPSMDDVVGRARVIRRNRRIASGVAAAAVVAVVAPVGFLAMNASGDKDSSPPVATNEPSPAPATSADYVVDGVWHRAGGAEIELPKRDYTSAALWNDLLVATYWDGEVFSIADVIDENGKVVESFDTTDAVRASEDGTTIAYVDTEGNVTARWDGGQVELAELDLSAAGDAIAYSVKAITGGGPDCADNCLVLVNSGTGDPKAYDSNGEVEGLLPGAMQYYGVDRDNGFLVSGVTKVADDHTCGGVYDVDAGGFRFETCEYHVEAISPNGRYVAAPPSYFDGLGPREISIIDVDTGQETGRYAPEGEAAHVAQWAWGADGRLVFDAYDGANWHLIAMSSNGALDYLGDPVKGAEMDSPFTLIQH